jgi:glycine oxidase
MRHFDVAVAGAGLIGAAIAWELAEAGLSVGVFDARDPGREASWASAGILSPAPENPGAIPVVPLGKASLALYPEFIAAAEESSGQRVGYRRKGTVEALFSSDAVRDLSTLIALHHGLGLKAEPLRPEDARELEPALSPDLAAAAFRPDEACVDNRLLMQAILSTAKKAGAQIFPGDGAQSILRQSNRCSGLQLKNETVSANWTVIAAGSFSSQIKGAEEFAPVRPAKGQILALRSDANAPKIDRVLWSDKIYLVPRDDGRIVVGATVEYVGYDKAITAGGLEENLAAAIELAPSLAAARIDEIWAGLRPDSPDHLPIIGPTGLDGLVIATGHFRSGVLLTPVTGKLIREWITLQRVSLDWDRFSPMRFAQHHEETRTKAV